MKKLFIIIGVIGFIAICIMAFTLQKDPYKIIPALTMFTFDRPAWLNFIIGVGGMYLIIVYYIYDGLVKED